MSNTIDTNPLASNEFQTHFGALPGTQDAKAECKEWERLCNQVIAERERLRGELVKLQTECDGYKKALSSFMCKDYVCPYTEEEILACIGREPPLSDLIDELTRELGAPHDVQG